MVAQALLAGLPQQPAAGMYTPCVAHKYNTKAAAEFVIELGFDLRRYWSKPGAPDHIEGSFYKASSEEIGYLQKILDQPTLYWPYKGVIVNAFRVQSENLTRRVYGTLHAEQCGILLGFHSVGDAGRFNIVRKGGKLEFSVPRPKLPDGNTNAIFDMATNGVHPQNLGQKGTMYGKGFYTAEDWQFVCDPLYRTVCYHDSLVRRVMVAAGVPGQDIQDVGQANPFTKHSSATFYRVVDGPPGGTYEKKVFIYHDRCANAHVCFPYIIDVVPPGHTVKPKN
jgi:hypothetical protein